MNRKQLAKKLLSKAGVEINGTNPWDIQIKNEQLYDRVFSHGTLGLGEAYMDGWWDAEKIDDFFFRATSAQLEKSPDLLDWKLSLFIFRHILFNAGSKLYAFDIGEKHYDIGNDLFELMLGKTMTYSCGYWKEAQNLEEAQIAKFDLICRKLQLRPGMRVLEIGCGWGGFAKYASEKYGVTVLGITVSREQATLAKKECFALPIEICLQDYRSLKGKFDRIVSIGMFEHVGYKNYKTYINKARELLRDDGLFLLHTIGGNRSVRAIDPWINKYIFPGAMIPSIKQIGNSLENIFVMEDWQNIGPDYDKTLMAWFKNFDANWEKISAKYGERFYRMWKFYLLSCAGGFRSRKNQLWQIVLSPKGIKGGYASIR